MDSEGLRVVGQGIVVGRPAATRAEWEAAREADAVDLNAREDARVYVAPLWSNADAPRCLQELRGFDDARVFALIPDAEREAGIAAVAAAGWVGAAHAGGEGLAEFLHVCAGLEVPVLVLDADPARVELALAGALEDLTPREIEAILQGGPYEPDADALEVARDMVEEGRGEE